MPLSTIGFTGLGLMGQGFTHRLVEKGHRVVGFDIDAGKVQAAAGWGVTPARRAAEVAEAADILTCVINTAAAIRFAIAPYIALLTAPRPARCARHPPPEGEG